MSKLTSEALWKSKKTLTADTHLHLILGSVKNMGLSLKYWQPHFLFFGMKDNISHELTEGKFPAKLEQDKSHPVFSLEILPDHTGVRVCPCSTKKPFHKGPHRYILADCRLNFTGLSVRKKTYITERITFLMPDDAAERLRFKGEVPLECIRTKAGSKKKGLKNG